MPSSLNTDCPRCRDHVGTEELGAPVKPPLPISDVRPGDVLGGSWRIVSSLGEGGMGSVFLADDLGLGRRVAIKLLGRGLIDDEISRARFEREAKLTAQLDHPNIVPIYATGSHLGRPFIVMKHVTGKPLHELLRERATPWDWKSARAIIAPLLAGLGYVHSRNLVHRDVKPSNVMIGAAGEVTLLDFGLIKTVAQEATVPGQVMGTWRYMAPEQMLGDETPDARADLYAVGVIAYQMLCGGMPFSGDNFAVAKQKLDHRGADPRRLNPTLPLSVSETLLRSIHSDRDQRQSTAAALLDDLDRAWAAPTPARRTRWLVAGTGLLVSIGTALVVAALRAPAPIVTTPRSELGDASIAPSDVPPLAIFDGGVDGGLDVPSPALDAGPVTRSPASDQFAKREKIARKVRVSIVTRVDGQPSFADVEVDGAAVGEAPVQLELTPGRHRLRVVRVGFKHVERSFVVQSGRVGRVVVDLER